MTPYSQKIHCTGCKAQLTIAANRDDEPHTRTAFTVSCPACHDDVHGEIPLSIMLASLQVVSFERRTATKD